MDNNKISFVCELNECKLFLENPITLPCGSTICQYHVDEKNENDNIFKCSICHQDHLIQTDNFTITNNQHLYEIIETGSYLKDIHKKINSSLEKFSSILNEHDLLNADEIIYNYMANIRNKVDLHREQMIEKINLKSDQILIELKEQEELLKLNAKKVKKSNLTNKYKDEQIKWKMMSRDPNLSNETNLINQIDNNLKYIQNQIDFIKKKYLMNTNIDFVPSDNSLFGELSIYSDEINFSSKFGECISCFDETNIYEITAIGVDKTLNRLITASVDDKIKIWDLDLNGKHLRTFTQSSITQILTNDSSQFITCSKDKTIKLWEFRNINSKRLKTIKNELKIKSMCFITNNTCLACGFDTGMINIWNLTNTNIKKSFKAHESSVCCLKLTKDQSKLISGSKDFKIKLWNLRKNNQCLIELNDHINTVSSFELKSNGFLISGSHDLTLNIWNLVDKKLLKSHYIGSVINFTQLINDNFILIGCGDGVNSHGEILVYDLNNEKIIRKFSPNFNLNIRYLNLLSNGNVITLSGTELKLWNFFN